MIPHNEADLDCPHCQQFEKRVYDLTSLVASLEADAVQLKADKQKALNAVSAAKVSGAEAMKERIIAHIVKYFSQDAVLLQEIETLKLETE